MKRSTPTEENISNGQQEQATSKPAAEAPLTGAAANAQTISRAEVQGKERYFAEELRIQRSPVNREEVRHLVHELTRMYTAPEGLEPEEPSQEAQAMQEGPTAQDDEEPHTSGAPDESSTEATDVLLGGEPPDEELDDDLTPLVAADTAYELAGKVLSGRYRLGERIGQGVSHVWLATDTHTDEPRAVKAVVGKTQGHAIATRNALRPDLPAHPRHRACARPWSGFHARNRLDGDGLPGRGHPGPAGRARGRTRLGGSGADRPASRRGRCPPCTPAA